MNKFVVLLLLALGVMSSLSAKAWVSNGVSGVCCQGSSGDMWLDDASRCESHGHKSYIQDRCTSTVCCLSRGEYSYSQSEYCKPSRGELIVPDYKCRAEGVRPSEGQAVCCQPIKLVAVRGVNGKSVKVCEDDGVVHPGIKSGRRIETDVEQCKYTGEGCFSEDSTDSRGRIVDIPYKECVGGVPTPTPPPSYSPTPSPSVSPSSTPKPKPTPYATPGSSPKPLPSASASPGSTPKTSASPGATLSPSPSASPR